MLAGGLWGPPDSAHMAGDRGLKHRGSQTAPSQVRGEEGWGELGRAEQICVGKVCTSQASEQRNLSHDVSNFIAGFFITRFAASALHLDSCAQGSFVCMFK